MPERGAQFGTPPAKQFHCENCGGVHPGTFHHDESRWTGSRHEPTGREVYEVVCPKDGMSDFLVGGSEYEKA